MRPIADECKDYEAFLKRFFPKEAERREREREAEMGKKSGGKGKGGKKGC